MSKAITADKDLIIKPITPEETEALFDLYKAADLLKYTDVEIPHEKNDIQNYLDAHCRKTETEYLFGIFLGSLLSGTVRIYNINHKHRFASLGIIISQNMQGKGLATKSIRSIIPYCFHDLNLNRLEAQVFENHTPSINLFTKLGFVKEGILRENFLIEGKLENSIMFALTQKDFFKQQQHS